MYMCITCCALPNRKATDRAAGAQVQEEILVGGGVSGILPGSGMAPWAKSRGTGSQSTMTGRRPILPESVAALMVESRRTCSQRSDDERRGEPFVLLGSGKAMCTDSSTGTGSHGTVGRRREGLPMMPGRGTAMCPESRGTGSQGTGGGRWPDSNIITPVGSFGPG